MLMLLLCQGQVFSRFRETVVDTMDIRGKIRLLKWKVLN